MRLSFTTMTFAALMGFLTTVASAGTFDGKKPLLCSVYQLFECDLPGGYAGPVRWC